MKVLKYATVPTQLRKGTLLLNEGCPYSKNWPEELIRAQSNLLRIFYERNTWGSNNNALKREIMQGLHGGLFDAAKRSVDTKLTRGNIASIRWNGSTSQIEFFRKEHLEKRMPLLIKGFFDTTNAYNVDKMMELYGDVNVFITNLQTRNNTIAPLRDLTPDGYVHNCEKLWYSKSKEHQASLQSLIKVDLCQKMIGRTLRSAQFFIGTGGNRGLGTEFHCANNHNFFYQLDGIKRWFFVNPSETAFLYPIGNTTKDHFESLLLFRDTSPLNTEKFPLLRFINRQSVLVEPGDMLYNPPWWWHAIEHVSEKTLSVSSRWGALAYATLARNDTNLLFTRLQMESPRMVIGAAILNAQKGFYYLNKPCFATPFAKNGMTLFENGAHENRATLEDTRVQEKMEGRKDYIGL